ncbi:MAG: FG-GAP-like repeat-containing protein [bacterium]|nr:FG-GAP-like repeat-containing protein [bacterium]
MNKVLCILIFILSTQVSEAKPWEEISTDFKNIKVGEFPAVCLVDIDADNDLDLFIGNWEGYLEFYRNTGSNNDPKYVMENSGASIKNSFEGVCTLNAAVPAWIDIDQDGDQDLFLGNISGCLSFYENIGTPTQPKLKQINKGNSKETSYFNIDVGYNSYPVFIDIDGDNDMDLFIGERDGFINYYQNAGDSHKPIFQAVNMAETMESSFHKIDVGECSVPYFIDIDQDNDPDLFIGNWEGYLFYYRNDGTKFEPYFKEINYAVSPDTSFNQYRSDGDCRLTIVKTVEKQFDFIFFQINGRMTWYRTTEGFKALISGEQKMDVAIKMANYYFEKAKEEYLKGNLIESRLILQKGAKYSEIKKIKDLDTRVNAEVKDQLKAITVKMKDNFAKGNFIEAIDHLMAENFIKASVILNQVKKTYNEGGVMDKYIQLAEKYENERRKLIRAEKLDNDAIGLYKQGKYQDALKLWENAASLMPDDYTILENIIMCKAAMDEVETTQVINKLVQDVNNYLRKGDKENALKAYVKIMDIGSIPPKIKSEIDSLKTDIMSFKEAAHEKQIEAIYQKGIKNMKENKYEQAIDAFKKVIFYKSDYKDVYEKLKLVRQKFMENEKMK